MLIVCPLLVVLDTSILNVSLDLLAGPRRGLGASQSDLAWVINAYTLAFAGLLFTFGLVADRVGRRRILLAGLAVFGIASAVCAHAGSPGCLIAARVLLGIGAAAIVPSALSIVINLFALSERPRVIGVWAGAAGLAIAIGPMIGGALLARFWWGSIFLVNVPVVLLGGAAVRLFVPESRNPSPGRIDPIGVVLSVLGLGVFVYGIIEAGQPAAWSNPRVLTALLDGAGLLTVFAWHERRSDHPALDVRVFRDARLSAAAAAIASGFFCLASVTFFMVFYLQSVRGLSPLAAGAHLLPLALAQLVSSLCAARLARRYGTKAVCATGMALTFGCLAGYLALGVGTPIWVAELIFLAQGIGTGIVVPTAMNSIQAVLPRQQAGTGTAISTSARLVGGALGVAVLGSVLSASYESRIRPHVAFLSPGLRRQTDTTVAATLASAATRGRAGNALAAFARSAFVAGMHAAVLGGAAVALIGLAVVLRWLPDRAVPYQARHRRSRACRIHAECAPGRGTAQRPGGPAGPGA